MSPKFYRAYEVTTDADGKSKWTERGVAFPHKNGAGFNLQLKEGVTVTGKLVLQPARSKSESQAPTA